MLKKKILLGVTGSIAAYKAAELIRLLRKNNFFVQVVLTKSAKQFVTPLTLQALSGNPVLENKNHDCFEIFFPQIDLLISHAAM